MNRLMGYCFFGAVAILMAFSPDHKGTITAIPENWPAPYHSIDTGIHSESIFQLGRKLFYDVNLSRDQSTSCATCHSQYNAFAHVDHNVSHGIEGRKGTRNAPALINLRWNKTFHWDGGVTVLETQTLNPIAHPDEMDHTLEAILDYLATSHSYRTLFYDAFEDSIPTSKTFLQAVAQFTGSLVSCNSKYDQVQRGEDTLTQQENNGLILFNQHCNSCHTAPLFTSDGFASNGLPIDTTFNDWGRYTITHNPDDSLLFRIPTLRNIQYTYPYMHDGRFKKLNQVIEYYTQIDSTATHLDHRLHASIQLSKNEQKDLLAFLYTLTDRDFLFNKRFEFPR